VEILKHRAALALAVAGWVDAVSSTLAYLILVNHYLEYRTIIQPAFFFPFIRLTPKNQIIINQSKRNLCIGITSIS
jgi:hypothetical protein